MSPFVWNGEKSAFLSADCADIVCLCIWLLSDVLLPSLPPPSPTQGGQFLSLVQNCPENLVCPRAHIFLGLYHFQSCLKFVWFSPHSPCHKKKLTVIFAIESCPKFIQSLCSSPPHLSLAMHTLSHQQILNFVIFKCVVPKGVTTCLV